MPDAALVARIDALWAARDHGGEGGRAERAARLQAAVNALRAELPDPGTGATPEERARLHYYHGKVLDCLPAYSKEAEAHLSKALKNDPGLVDAWLTLGHCAWRKDNVAEALSNFQMAESLAPNDRRAVREVARVLRLTGADAAARRRNVAEAAERARRAVALDVSDGLSWYVLGNCLLSLFMQGPGDATHLAKALKAYTQAEAKGEAENPDLHFNKAVVLKFRVEFEAAYAGFAKALALDPALEEAIHEMVGLRLTLTLAADRLALRRSLPTRTLDRHAAELPPFGALPQLPGQLRVVPMQQYLQGGAADSWAAGDCVALFVLHLISRPTDTPLLYVACDRQKTTTAVIIYNVSTSAVKEGDELVVPQPDVRHQQFTLPAWSGGPLGTAGTAVPEGAAAVLASCADYSFHCIVVSDPTKVFVGRKKIPADRLLTPQLTVTAFT